MRRKVVSVLIIAMFLVGCAGTAKLSTTGKAAMILATYNSQATDTVAMSNRPNLTESQKDVVRKKKELFLKLDPKVKAYGRLVKRGGVPSIKDEQDIYNIIDELVLIGE